MHERLITLSFVSVLVPDKLSKVPHLQIHGTMHCIFNLIPALQSI
jgi:hypothetical protein